MTRHLEREIAKLKDRILKLGTVVEESVAKAVRAVEERNPVLAREVIDGDNLIDDMEVDIEEECLKVLALHQPVAIDLRLIVAVLKMNNDLERIGDYAQNIASRAERLCDFPPLDVDFHFHGFFEKVRALLRGSLESLIDGDPEKARQICDADDEVDDLHRRTYRIVNDGVRNSPDKAEHYISVLSISRNLERIADHATNIAEDVIYMIQGEIVRHGRNRA